jgi:sigma-B regulation protein RsbU (phosphoserine phosphatase)
MNLAMSQEQIRIQELEDKIRLLEKDARRAMELTESVARANANAAEMYLELEEKSRLIKILKDQMEEELMRARDVQIAIMCPEVASLPAMDIAVKTRPASLINGDFYIIHPLDNRHTAIMVADGVGHGVPAALMGIMAKTYFLTESLNNFTAGSLLSRLNIQLNENLFEGAYITAFLLIYDSISNRINYSGAGHPDAIFWKYQDRKEIVLVSENPPLGVISNFEYMDRELQFAKGDRFFLCSDGIEETRGPQKSFFGSFRLREYIMSMCPHYSVKEIQEKLFNALEQFSGGLEQKDDQTFIGLEILADAKSEEELKPGSEELRELFKMGSGFLAQKKFEDAILIFEKICSFQPNNIKARFNLGTAYIKSKNPDKALSNWQKVNKLMLSPWGRKLQEKEKTLMLSKIGELLKKKSL